ncbi:GxxExxY protein [Altererythrobacter soli]|uniref:GxxExxY protein n=1 Tax=Croceibacterium soli TaxID=1739690 RepID=A0A6I4UV58_9SPHN|nr:GxxExxY protein [Croceibacterium soli]MXP40915.1 GxxExxY protein [Croceibacterium soli]
MKPIDHVTSDVLNEAIRIHRGLGPGLLESVYESVLAASLERMRYKVDRQLPIDVKFDGLRFPGAFRVDLMVDNRLILEIKSVEKIGRAHGKQLLKYLRLTNQPVGLLLNFAAATMKEGIQRVVNDYRPPT